MRRSIPLILAAVCGLQACASLGEGLATIPKVQRASVRVQATAPPSATPTATPTPAPTPSPTPRPTATPTPAPPAAWLEGLARIDAHYVVAAGAGSIIAAGGGNVIAAGGGNIIAAGGGNVIAPGGGNVIAAGGGNILAGGTGLFRLLEAASVPLGTLLPVKGLVVVPVSLRSGRAIGEAVRTDERGAFKLSVADEHDNVRLYAALPGTSADDAIVKDPKLRYHLITAAKAGEARQLDEDTALVSQFIRESFRDKFRYFLNPTTVQNGTTGGSLTASGMPDALKAQVAQLEKTLTDRVKAAAVPDEQLGELALKAADLMLAELNFEGMPISPLFNQPGLPYAPVPGGPVVARLVTIMKHVREEAQARLDERPDYFAEKPYMKAALHPMPIVRPSDVCAFIAAEYCGGVDATFDKIEPLRQDLHLTVEERNTLSLCGKSIGLELLLGYSGKEAQLLALIDSFGTKTP